MFTILHNAEDTVQVGDTIRPIFIPSVSTSLAVDRPHYYEGDYKVEAIEKNYDYPLDGDTRGFGTVAYITVNQNLNNTARAAFPAQPMMEGDRMYYVSHFLIVDRGPNYVDPSNPVIELTEQEKEIAALKELNRVQSERIEKLLGDVVHNSSVLSVAFRTQKEERGWCDEANRIASEVNGELRGGLEIECEEDFQVEVEVEASFRTVISVGVRAASFEAAQDMVMDDPSSFIENWQINDELAYNDWTDIDYNLY